MKSFSFFQGLRSRFSIVTNEVVKLFRDPHKVISWKPITFICLFSNTFVLQVFHFIWHGVV